MMDIFHVEVQRGHEDSYCLRAFVVEELYNLKNKQTNKRNTYEIQIEKHMCVSATVAQKFFIHICVSHAVLLFISSCMALMLMLHLWKIELDCSWQ